MKEPLLPVEPEPQPIRKYLLGMLPEEEAVRLDEQLFSGNAMLETFEEEQERLIEDFLNRQLSPEEASRFRDQCSRSPILRKNVEELETLLAGLGRGPRAHSEKQLSPGWRRLFVILAPALALALCCTAALYVHQRRVSRDLEAQLSRASLAVSPHQPAAAPPVTARPAGAGQPYAAFLSAEVARGEGSIPHLSVPAGASTVALQIEVRGSAPENSLWTVALLENGASIWTSARIPLRFAGDQKFLELDLSARVLEPGAYELQFAPTAQPQTIQTRQFVVGGQ